MENVRSAGLGREGRAFFRPEEKTLAGIRTGLAICDAQIGQVAATRGDRIDRGPRGVGDTP